VGERTVLWEDPPVLWENEPFCGRTPLVAPDAPEWCTLMRHAARRLCQVDPQTAQHIFVYSAHPGCGQNVCRELKATSAVFRAARDVHQRLYFNAHYPLGRRSNQRFLSAIHCVTLTLDRLENANKKRESPGAINTTKQRANLVTNVRSLMRKKAADSSSEHHLSQRTTPNYVAFNRSIPDNTLLRITVHAGRGCRVPPRPCQDGDTPGSRGRTARFPPG
jgi:hypothetical protein